MTHITKHHSEEKGEGSDCKHSRISLQVPWNTVCVNNPLINSREFVSFYVSRSSYVVILVHRDSHGTVGGKPLRDIVLLIYGSPEVAGKGLRMPFHHIQSLEKCFLFSQEHLVDVDS